MSYIRSSQIVRVVAPVLIIGMLILLVMFNRIESNIHVIDANMNNLSKEIPVYIADWRNFLKKHPLPQEQVDNLNETFDALSNIDIKNVIQSQEEADAFSNSFENYQSSMNKLWESLDKDSKLLTVQASREEIFAFVQKQREFNMKIRLFSSLLESHNNAIADDNFSIINKLFFVREPVTSISIKSYPVDISSLGWEEDSRLLTGSDEELFTP